MPSPLQQAKAAVEQIEKIRDDIEKTLEGAKDFHAATKKTIDAFMARTEGKPCYKPYRELLLKGLKIIKSKVKVMKDMLDYADWVWDIAERGLNNLYDAERHHASAKVIKVHLSAVLRALSLAERIRDRVNKEWGNLLDMDESTAFTIEAADLLCGE